MTISKVQMLIHTICYGKNTAKITRAHSLELFHIHLLSKSRLTGLIPSNIYCPRLVLPNLVVHRNHQGCCDGQTLGRPSVIPSSWCSHHCVILSLEHE